MENITLFSFMPAIGKKKFNKNKFNSSVKECVLIQFKLYLPFRNVRFNF